ncbi:MAG: type VI secretion system baseplate subunit TssE [Pirellula sp.]
MSRVRSDQLLLPSILDRLIDYEPYNRKETPKDRNQLLRELKASVRRDLENLLNTRVPFTKLPKNAPHLESSLWNYGVPDFASVVLESGQSMELMRMRIEQAIQRFETRFMTVRVELEVNDQTKFSRFIRFAIDGVLYAEPAPEPVRFSSMLSSVGNEFKVKEGT